MTPLDQIRQMIQEATGGADHLTFGGRESRWQPLDDWKSFPDEPGVYAIGLKLGVKYPQMVSRIIYFGSTLNCKLRYRMRAHATGGHNDRLKLLQQRFPGGLECTYIVLAGLNREWLLALEDAAMQEAFRSFGCYSICNYQPLSAKHRDDCRELVRILPCEGLHFPQKLSSLNCGVGELNSDKPPKNGWASKRGGNHSIKIIWRTSIGDDVDKEAINVSDSSATMLGTATTNNREVEHLSWFCDSNVAVWSQEKMERIVALCQKLKAAKPQRRSKVVTFDAPARSVPHPDTWGEVALLKAREVAGTFYPEKRVWLKVRFEKVLLGQAFLEPFFYRGEDKSDLPQTNSREEIDHGEAWAIEVAAIPAELPPDFQMTRMEIIQVPDTGDCNPIVQEHLAVLRSAQAYDIKMANRQAAFEREMALEQSRSLKAYEMLTARIELRYRAAVDHIAATTKVSAKRGLE